MGGERGFENEYNTSSPGEGSYPGDGSYPSYPGEGSYPGDGSYPSYPGEGSYPGDGSSPSYPGEGSYPGDGSFPSYPGEGSYPGDGSFPSYPGDGSYPEDDLSGDESYTDMDPGRDHHDPFSIPDLSELSKVGNNRDEEFQQKGDALYIDKDTDRIFVLKDNDPNNTPILLKDTWQGETFLLI